MKTCVSVLLLAALVFVWRGVSTACTGTVTDVSIFNGFVTLCVADDACPCPALGGGSSGPRCFSLSNTDLHLNRFYALALVAKATAQTVVIDETPSGPLPGTCGLTAMRLTQP